MYIGLPVKYLLLLDRQADKHDEASNHFAILWRHLKIEKESVSTFLEYE